MAGENSLFAAAGFSGTPDIPYGAATFRVMGMSYGIEMDYVEKEARDYRSIYFTDQMDDNFAVGLGFNGYGEYARAAAWFQAYSTFVTDPQGSTTSPMSVYIPFVNFQGIGIPTNGVTYGDSVGELMYILNLTFQGTYQVLVDAGTSSYQQADLHGQSQYFYPSGVQTGASQGTPELTLYQNKSNGQTQLKTITQGQSSVPISTTYVSPNGYAY